MKIVMLIVVLVFVAVCNFNCLKHEVEIDLGIEYRKSDRFEKDIKRFEAADVKQAPPEGAVLCYGSSSIRMWHDKLTEDMVPLTLVLRGFGGSNMNDALNFSDRVVLPYKPRAIVLYEGDNDISQGVSPERVVHTFRLLVNKVHKELPDCRFYFIAIKPSISRKKLWPQMREANLLIAEQCVMNKRLTYVDIASVMLTDEGNPREDIFVKDGLHLNRKGYLLWRDMLKPILLKRELRYEGE